MIEMESDEQNYGEKQLVQRAQAGDTAAFTELYNRHYDRVSRFMRYRLPNDPYTAEDLTQATFLGLYESLHLYRDTGTDFGAWISRIMTNKLADHFRKDYSRKSIEDPAELSIVGEKPGSNNTERSALASIAIRNVFDEMSRLLTPAEFDVVAQVGTGDIEQKAYAADIDESEGAVRIRLHRARLKLQHRFGDPRDLA